MRQRNAGSVWGKRATRAAIVGAIAVALVAAHQGVPAMSAWDAPLSPGTQGGSERDQLAPPNRLLARVGEGGEGVGSGLGVNIHFTAGRQSDLRRIRALGMRLVRTDLLWAQVETRPGAYDWDQYDALLTDAKASGLTPLLILSYSNPLYAPRQAGRPDVPSLGYAAPARGVARKAYMAFVAAAAARYRGRVIWEVWNEPDLNFGDPPDLTSYIGFAQEACRHIRDADPEAPVLGPAAARLKMSFLNNFAAADQAGCFDGLSVHPYREDAPEGVLADWARLRALVARHRTLSRPRSELLLVASEWGYSSVGGPVAERHQADYLVRIALLGLVAGVPVTILYDWQNDGPDPDEKEMNYGLVDFEGEAKPAYDAIAALHRELQGLRYLGRVRTRRPWDFVLAFGRGGTAEKLVMWTTVPQGATTRLVVQEPACVDPLPGPSGVGGTCRTTGMEGLRMTLPPPSRRPTVLELPRF